MEISLKRGDRKVGRTQMNIFETLAKELNITLEKIKKRGIIIDIK